MFRCIFITQRGTDGIDGWVRGGRGGGGEGKRENQREKRKGKDVSRS